MRKYFRVTNTGAERWQNGGRTGRKDITGRNRRYITGEDRTGTEDILQAGTSMRSVPAFLITNITMSHKKVVYLRNNVFMQICYYTINLKATR